jgi:hypothetical protein
MRSLVAFCFLGRGTGYVRAIRSGVNRIKQSDLRNQVGLVDMLVCGIDALNAFR